MQDLRSCFGRRLLSGTIGFTWAMAGCVFRWGGVGTKQGSCELHRLVGDGGEEELGSSDIPDSDGFPACHSFARPKCLQQAMQMPCQL